MFRLNIISFRSHFDLRDFNVYILKIEINLYFQFVLWNHPSKYSEMLLRY
jgi:hypothetical protein